MLNALCSFSLGGGVGKEKSVRMKPLSASTKDSGSPPAAGTSPGKGFSMLFKKDIYEEFLASMRQESNPEPLLPEKDCDDGCLRVRDYALHGNRLKALSHDSVYYRAFDFQFQMVCASPPFPSTATH